MNNNFTIIHVDDDNTFLEHFKKTVDKEPDVTYHKGFNNVIEALEYMKKTSPDLIFLDIEMPQHNGFWLADQLKNMPSDIVFLTSHADYALKAFEACAVDYLLKPITGRKLSEFLERYKSRKSKKNGLFDKQLKELVSNYLVDTEVPSRIFINTAGKVDIINLADTLYFSSKGSFTEVVMKDGIKYTSGKSIKTYEEAIFKNKDFLRIHRNIIINKTYVKTILKDSKKHRFAVVMQNSDELEISFLRKEEILNALIK